MDGRERRGGELMRRWAVALVAMLALPLVGAQQAWSGWTQPGGDAQHSGVANFGQVQFDVLASYPIPLFGTVFSRAETMGIVATPRGVAGFGVDAETSRCWTFEIYDVLLGMASGTSPAACDATSQNCNAEPGVCVRAGTGVLGYDAARDALIVTEPGFANDAVLVLRTVSDGVDLWRLRPIDLGAQAVPDEMAEDRWRAVGLAVDAEADSIIVGLRGQPSRGILAEVGLGDGRVRWTRALEPYTSIVGSATGVTAPLAANGNGAGFQPDAVTLTDQGIVVSGTSSAFGLASGAVLWFDRDGTPVGGLHAEMTQPLLTAGEVSRGGVGDYYGSSRWPTASGRLAAMALGTRAFVIDPAARSAEREVDLGLRQGVLADGNWQAPVWWLDTLVLPVARTLQTFEAPELAPRWTWSDSVAASIADLMLVPPGDVHVLVARNTTIPGDVPEVALVRLSLEAGSLVQRLPLPIAPVLPTDSVNPQTERSSTPNWPGHLLPLPERGLLVVWADQGDMVVLGEAEDALRPALTLSSAYPPAGTPVTLNAIPANGVPVERFIVAWGDGTIETLLPDEIGLHQYAEERPHTLRVTAVFDDQRTATAVRTLDVGGNPPRELNLAQKAFDRDNQDLTFGVLGIAVALAGGLFAVTRTRTRRRRVQRELDAVESAYASTRDRPLACEAALAERKAHVRGLGLDGRLDQSEVLVLERRIDELAQRLRLDSIDEQFPFLPVSMARTLRDMLADGRIVSWERDHFVRALEEDAHLTKQQKTRVRKLIDEWFARDASGAG